MNGGEILEADFASRLRSLGVETSGLSFGWMLNEYDSEGILRWMFTRLDSGNALTKRESYRYAELKDKELLSEEELEATISDILEEHKGLTLPGDKDGLERAKQENAFLEDRLSLLKKQERTLHTLMKQNELAKDEVTHQISELKEDQVLALAELDSAKTVILKAAENVTQKEQQLYKEVAKHLQVYIDYQPGEDIPKQFQISGPLEVYNQKKRQFKSQLKMRAARDLDLKRWTDKTDVSRQQADSRTAKQAEKRLYDGIINYVEAVSDYYHTYNIIQVMATPMDVHPSRIATLMSETQSALTLLRQQESATMEEIRHSARELTRQQTRRHTYKHAHTALIQRRQIYNIMSSLHATVREYAGVDSLLYLLLRRQWLAAQDTIQFAQDVRDYLLAERSSLASRIDAMTSLTQEHTECRNKITTDNNLLNALTQLYQVSPEESLQQKMSSVRSRTVELKEEILAEFERKEDYLEDMRVRMRPLASLVWDGPDSNERTLASLLYQLRQHQASTDNRLTDHVDMFTTVKAKDKDIGRKLWQWFLTDPERMVAKLEELRSRCLN